MDNKVQQIKLLREQVQNLPPDQTAEIERLQGQIAQLRSQMQKELTPWDQVQLARHPERPYTLDYVSRVFSGFKELHGDRKFYDDPAIIGGMARLNHEPSADYRPSKGSQHEAAHLPELRNAEAGGISKSNPAHEAG